MAGTSAGAKKGWATRGGKGKSKLPNRMKPIRAAGAQSGGNSNLKGRKQYLQKTGQAGKWTQGRKGSGTRIAVVRKDKG